MIKIFKKLNLLLDKKQKRSMGGLLVLMIIGAMLQTLGVSMLVEVVTVVVNPENATNNAVVANIYESLGFTNYNHFSIMVMVMLIVVFVVKNIFLYFQQKLTFAFVYTNQFRTSERLMRNFMRRGYEFYLNADTAVVQRNITSDVNNMYAMILAILQLMSDGVLSVFIAAYCLSQSGMLTIILAAVLILLMIAIKRTLKPILYKAGQDNQNYYSGLFKWISQTVQGIKEVKVTGREQYFISEYSKCGNGYVNAVQKYSLYNNIPKLLTEVTCVAVMMGYMIALTASGSTPADILQILSTLAAAAFILLPCVNRINNQINSLSYFEPFFMGVSDNLQDEINQQNTDISGLAVADKRFEVKDKIELKNIVYAYPNTDKLIFDHADIEIPIGAAVGVVGTSGAGKSTVVDILLGLLEIREGQILADGMDVKTNYRGWLQNIGYIPQMIFMLDDTIRKNVAFGVPEEEIDEDRLWQVLKDAQLDEFIRTLPEGVNTGIGERGIRLSGGQRQRIGIARALYHNPEILVLDEATSALDNDTEKAIMDSINRFQGEKTLIIIAHRLQTIEKCDIVYRVENGKATIEKGSINR